MRSPLVVLCVLLAVVAGVFAFRPEPADLVVYCAHDAAYSEPFLQRFTARTGIRVAVRYDQEATKSLGLTELIEREKDNPRCDVFWNNEPLGTIRLAEQGLLEAYSGPGQRRIPAAYRDPQDRWIGFAGRLRVWIVNTRAMTADRASIASRLAAPRLTRMAIARPLFGTTRSQVTAMFDALGAEKAKAWHADLRARGIQVVSGNSTVKNLVAAGTLDLGLTDTDDYYLAVDDGQPVAMVPARIPGGKVLCIPNTAAIIRGTRHRAAAEQLIDYLSSAESEVELANSRSRQIPLGPVADRELPECVRELRAIAAEGYVHRDQRESSARALAFLKAEYAR